MGEKNKDPRVTVDYGREVLNWGISAIPRVILRFYRHLTSDGEKLDDREMMPLVLLLALWEDGERELRLSNLPSSTPVDTLERRYLRKWRQMGIVFTRRVYYTHEEMASHYGGAEKVPDSPRLKARVFDLSSLVHNCLRVARLWREAYPTARAAWEAGGKGERPPHPHIPPPDFAVEVELPLEVARRIADPSGGGKEGYQFVPEKWVVWARENVPAQIVPVQGRTGTDRAGTEVRTGTDRAGTGARTGTNRAGQLDITSPYGEETPGTDVPGGPPGGGPASTISQFQQPEEAATPGIAAGGEETLVEATATRAAGAGRTPGGPAGCVSGKRATPARPPADRVSANRTFANKMFVVEPLPQRRRRVLDDLRRARDRRQRVSIVTANLGEVLGLGLEPDGSLRTRPDKRDYARVGGMMKRHGDEQVWILACRAAGNAVEGDPLDYLEACLRQQSGPEQGVRSRRRKGGHNGNVRRKDGTRDNYPESPDEYGDGYEV